MASEFEQYKHLLPQLFIEKLCLVDGPLPTQCWMWMAGCDKCGYGRFSDHRRYLGAHRFSYKILKGNIPDRYELDHLCKNRRCVNPFHTEPVTHTENVTRSDAGIWQREKTHCPKGHLYDLFNTYYYTDGKYQKRGCLICRRERSAIANLRKKQNV